MAVDTMALLDERPALKAWVHAHERERKRLGMRFQREYAQWLGCDPADWSRYCSGGRVIPQQVGVRILADHPEHPEWKPLWLRLRAEEEQRALRRAPAPPPCHVADHRPPDG